MTFKFEITPVILNIFGDMLSKGESIKLNTAITHNDPFVFK